MTQKELVKQANENIRKRNREHRKDMINFLELWQSISFLLIGILIVGVVGGSLYSFFVHIDMISGNWEYPYGQTEIVLTGIGSLPCVIMVGLLVLFIVGLAIYSVITTIIERNADKKRELEKEISKLSKDNTNESK